MRTLASRHIEKSAKNGRAANRRNARSEVSGQTLGLILTAGVIFTGLLAGPASLHQTSSAATADSIVPSVMVGAGTEGYSGETDKAALADSSKSAAADEDKAASLTSATANAADEETEDEETEDEHDTRVKNQTTMWLSSMAESLDNLPASYEQKIPSDSGADEVLKLASTIGGRAQQVVTDNLRMSHEDYNTLCNIVEAECTGGTEKSKLLVANVILNRVADEHFPDNIHDVVYQRLGGTAQFSPTQDGRMGTLKISDETKSAIRRALEGEDISKGALFFMARDYAAKSNIEWFDETLTYLYSYGGHDFYKFK